MNKASDVHKNARISDAAVKAKTGQNWEEWIATLDPAGALLW